jgi:hypothetical protein
MIAKTAHDLPIADAPVSDDT